MLRGAALLIAATLLLAGCGGGSNRSAPPTPKKAATPCVSPKAAKAIVRINRDIAAIRTNAAANRVAAVSAATDRFMNDTFTAPIGNLQRNRFIDHAAAALQGTCPDCFQALEANRPIVTIVHQSHKGNCRK